MSVSVIICAYTLDRWDDLTDAIASAQRQTISPDEIIVVVDNNDDLLRRVRASFEAVRVVANHHGPGLSGGRNTGADIASGRILVFLDDDAVAEPQWIEQHLAGFTTPDVLGVGGDVKPIWRSSRPAWFPSEFLWVVGCTYTGMPVTPQPIRNPIGANMSIRADVFHRVGGFRQELGRRDIGGRAVTGTADETEFCIRALRTYPQGTWLYRPSASVGHVVPHRRATWRHFRERCRLEGASKAVLVGIRGPELGLASERRYVASVLPVGVLREIRDALRGRPGALARAAAITSGVTLTAGAFLQARAAIVAGRGERYVS
jgi:glycosyltransferase involved in cell wall biosynthesis